MQNKNTLHLTKQINSSLEGEQVEKHSKKHGLVTLIRKNRRYNQSAKQLVIVSCKTIFKLDSEF